MNKQEGKYANFFNQFNQFQDKRNQQKQRGLNDYNILTTVLDESDEVRLHSRIIASLLDPDGNHNQGILFLEEFLKIIDIADLKINAQKCSVYTEYQNIDIYIEDGDRHIIIENKIYAGDQKEQIKRYVTAIKKGNKNLEPKDILVIYLTLDGKQPSEESLGNFCIKEKYILKNDNQITLYRSLNYDKDILPWLKTCQHEVENITNLNQIFQQYIDVITMLYGKYKEKAMNLTDFITRNKEQYNMASEISNKFPNLRHETIVPFFDKVRYDLEKELGNAWKVVLVGTLSTKHGFPFRVYKKEWRVDDVGQLIFGFEFDENDYYGGCLGLVRTDETVCIKNDVVDEFKKKLAKTNVTLNTTKWWLYWEDILSDDMVESILFKKNAEKEFVDKFYSLIKEFELENGLISEINKWCLTTAAPLRQI